MKLKIFCQYINYPSLSPTSGDKINEIRFYRALSEFADIYYNDHLVDWSSDELGVPGKLNPPSRQYDLYYVRGNHELLQSLPHPKATMAYPYDPKSFAEVDAVFVTTQAWSDLLKQHNGSVAVQQKLAKWYPEQIEMPRNIVNIQQTIDPMFCEEPSSAELLYWRARTTGAPVFGFFGRVTEETIPRDLLNAIEYVRDVEKSTVSPLAAFSGSIRTKLPNSVLNLGTIAYRDMPKVIRVCHGTLGQSCKDSDYLGSGKILDSIACGTPIITKENLVRVEQLGAEYPGLFNTQEQANEILLKLCTDEDFVSEVRSYLLSRRSSFLPKASGNRIRDRLIEAELL